MKHSLLSLALVAGMAGTAFSAPAPDIDDMFSKSNIESPKALRDLGRMTDTPNLRHESPTRRTPEPQHEAQRIPAGYEWIANVTEGDFRYTVYTNGSSVIAKIYDMAEGLMCPSKLVIPDEINYNGGKIPVALIGGYAFYRKSQITELVIGNNVWEIGDCAFSATSIKTLTIPESVTLIGSSAFSETPVESVTFQNASSQDTPLVLGSDAFTYCFKLKTFEVPARMVLEGENSFYTDFYNPFAGCTYLESITINPAYRSTESYSYEIVDNALCAVSNSGVGRIVNVIAYPSAAKKSSFTVSAAALSVAYNCLYDNENLQSVSLTSTLEPREGKVNMVINSDAFTGSKIKSLSISAKGDINLKSGFATECSYLESITIAQTVTNYDVVDNVVFSNNEYVGRYLHTYPSGKKDAEYTVPDVVYINTLGIAWNTHLKKIILPARELQIWERAFINDSQLSEVVYNGPGITYAGMHAFYGTPFLENLPAGPALLGRCLIGYIGNVPAHLELSDDIISLSEGAFANCKTLESVKLPSGLSGIPYACFNNCSALSEVEWPTHLLSVNSEAFGYTALKEIVLPPSCYMIGQASFAGISTGRIQVGSFDPDFNGPDNGFIYNYAFQNTSCTSLKIGKGFDTLWDLSFYGLRSTEPLDLIIPAGIKWVCPMAFYNATGINSVYLPSTVVGVGITAFYNTFEHSPLKEVVVNRTTAPIPLDYDYTEYDGMIFDYTTMDSTPLVIPIDAEVASYAYYNCWNFRNIEKREISGIDTVIADSEVNDAPAEYFDLQGRRISPSNLTTGIYIVRRGPVIEKTVIR